MRESKLTESMLTELPCRSSPADARRQDFARFSLVQSAAVSRVVLILAALINGAVPRRMSFGDSPFESHGLEITSTVEKDDIEGLSNDFALFLGSV